MKWKRGGPWTLPTLPDASELAASSSSIWSLLCRSLHCYHLLGTRYNIFQFFASTWASLALVVEGAVRHSLCYDYCGFNSGKYFFEKKKGAKHCCQIMWWRQILKDIWQGLYHSHTLSLSLCLFLPLLALLYSSSWVALKWGVKTHIGFSLVGSLSCSPACF